MVLSSSRLVMGLVICFFVFKQKTAYEMRISDWSSDVCSSDLRIVTRQSNTVGVIDIIARVMHLLNCTLAIGAGILSKNDLLTALVRGSGHILNRVDRKSVV